MTIFEYYKQAYQSMKDKSPQERKEYFLEYYKWPALCVLLAVILLISTIVSFATRKDTALSVMLINSQPAETSELLEGFTEHIELNTKKEEVVFQTGISIGVQQAEIALSPLDRIIASVATKDVDCILAPNDAFVQCAYSTTYMLADLRDHLDAGKLEKYADFLYYIDGDVVAKLADWDGSTALTFPDPKAPDAMSNPIPVGIDLSQCGNLLAPYYPGASDLYIGIVVNTTHPAHAQSFIDYLLS